MDRILLRYRSVLRPGSRACSTSRSHSISLRTDGQAKSVAYALVGAANSDGWASGEYASGV